MLQRLIRELQAMLLQLRIQMILEMYMVEEEYILFDVGHAHGDQKLHPLEQPGKWCNEL